jgi:hypothetical protein
MKSSTSSREGCSHRAGVAHAMLGAALALSLAGCSPTEDESGDGGIARDSSIHDAAGDVDGNGPDPKDASSQDAASDGDRDGDALAADDTAIDARVIDPLDASSDAAVDPDVMVPALEDLPYAREVVDYEEGESSGFGQNMFPEIVLGPPKGKGTGSGSLDVLSLGVGGSIVIGFGENDIVDGEGPDFIVFENPFIGAGSLFMELGEVSVSEDGTTWHTFPCDEAGAGDAQYPGCAGWTPTLRFDPQRVFPLDPELTGGDAFDLSDLGLSRARYVRIQDLGTQPGSANTGGFDLDAIGLIRYD